MQFSMGQDQNALYNKFKRLKMNNNLQAGKRLKKNDNDDDDKECK